MDIQNYRLAALWQWGGYSQGNGTTGLYQGQVGGDFTFFTSGVLSLDAIGSFGRNAVSTGIFGTLTHCSTITEGQTGCSYDSGASGTIPEGYNNTDVTATLSNNTGFMGLAKYKWEALTLFGGYEVFQQQNPSDTYQNGFRTIGSLIPSFFTRPRTFERARYFA